MSNLAATAENIRDRLKHELKSKEYVAVIPAAAKLPVDSTLEIGSGSGHGFTMEWLRFVPTKDMVNVLRVQYDEGFKQYRTKWPPDITPVFIQKASMTTSQYADLIKDIAMVSAVKLRPIEKDFLNGSITSTWSSDSFLASAKVFSQQKMVVDLNFAGYRSSSEEINYAKPETAMKLATEAVARLPFKADKLNDEDRAWASAKFIRDWKQMKASDDYWWVKERYLVTIGVAGNSAVIPCVREILLSQPILNARGSNDRIVYYAINALTRLSKKDVRTHPVEQMDIRKNRDLVIQSLAAN